jgi:hypothetical protein
MHVQLNNDRDVFVCGFTALGGFTVKSMYLDLLNDNTKYLRKYIWKMKVPLKIKVFLWFLHRKVILTKDMVKINWNGHTTCCFSDKNETIQHLFLNTLLLSSFGTLFI